jgi:hypothetical protein
MRYSSTPPPTDFTLERLPSDNGACDFGSRSRFQFRIPIRKGLIAACGHIVADIEHGDG